MGKFGRLIFTMLFYVLIATLLAFVWFYPWTAESNSWVARGIMLAVVVAITFLGLLALIPRIDGIDISGGVFSAKIDGGEDDESKQ